ncbi:MAG: isoprenylcysteine carboxylmethyltransferase family protein [Anaerolineae bacterium]|nr:isoprenylcysteine carboxylmethyltransferase family protein [Anaerolineae bacterium]
MDEMIFRGVTASIFVLLILPRAIYRSLTRRITAWMPLWQRILTFVLTVAPLLMYIAWPRGVAWAGIAITDWLRIVGVGAGMLACALFWWANAAMNHAYHSGEVGLVTTGPYRWVRHPMYAAFFLVSLSFLLAAANLCIGLMWIGVNAVAILPNLRAEERHLEQQFGEAYRRYAERTGALWPRLIP